jgi:hypothetical protein
MFRLCRKVSGLHDFDLFALELFDDFHPPMKMQKAPKKVHAVFIRK